MKSGDGRGEIRTRRNRRNITGYAHKTLMISVDRVDTAGRRKGDEMTIEFRFRCGEER